MPLTEKFTASSSRAKLFSALKGLSHQEVRAARDFLKKLVAVRTIPGFGTSSQERSWIRHLSLPDSYLQVELDCTLEILESFIRN